MDCLGLVALHFDGASDNGRRESSVAVAFKALSLPNLPPPPQQEGDSLPYLWDPVAGIRLVHTYSFPPLLPDCTSHPHWK